MKRKIWNKMSVPQQRSTGSYLRIDPRSGGITFSLDLAKSLDLEKNKINFIQDEDRLQDWYLEITESENGFSIRPKKGNKGSILQNTALARAILKSIGAEGSTRLMVATESMGENLFAIITKNAIPTKTSKQKAA